MAPIDSLLSELGEQQIVDRVTRAHDEYRARYVLRRNTVATFDEFTDELADYYAGHFSHCVSRGGSMPKHEAAGRAKEILERHFRNQDGNIVTAFNDANKGTRSGLRYLLDIICQAFKAEAAERYTRLVFEKYFSPHCWQDRLELTRQFIAQCDAPLREVMDAHTPERYARDLELLIRSFNKGIQETSAIMRRL